MVTTTGGTLNPETDDGPRLSLLGPVELVGQVKLRFQPERRFRLLAYLALQRDWIARDQLAYLFWPDRSQDAARNNLRKLLFEVRALGLPALEDSRQALRWQIDHDVAELLRAHSKGDHARVLHLYRGTPLQGLDGGDSPAFATWLRGERLRLRAMWRESVLATVRDAAPQTAVELSQLLLDDDPFDEDAVRVQMRALAVLGRSTDVAQTYRSYAERVAEELGVDVAIETRNLARELQLETPSARVGAPAVTSAEGSDSFVGRSSELAELQALLAEPQCRLITVTGPGGMGKSRLVKEVIHRRPTHASETVRWIALDDLTDIAQVAPRVAHELKIELTALQDPIEVVATHLASLSALLVFDNSEHLPSLSDLVERWLKAAPQLKILATSRTRIGVRSEWLVTLRGLEVPSEDTGDAVLQSDAVRLFVAQAQLAQPRFDPSSNAKSVAGLVRALGGMPLAILLAASWVRLLPVTNMVSDLTHLLDVLDQADEGDERPEHRSVRATFEQSWRLLAPSEQRALTALSVTAGGFTHIAAKAIADAPLPLLGALHDKSLLQSDRTGRFSLHPLIQQFAAEKLNADLDTQSAVQRMHAEFFAQMLARHSDVRRVAPKLLMAEIGPELANCRLAWATLVALREAKWLTMMAAPLKHYLQITGRVNEALTLLAQAETMLTGDDVSSRLAAATASRLGASAMLLIGRVAEAQAKAESALPLCRALSDGDGTKACINLIGLALWRAGRGTEALTHFEELLRLAESDRDATVKAIALQNLGIVKAEADQLDAAATLLNRALEAHRVTGNVIGEVETLNSIGNVSRSRGVHAAAVAAYREALRLSDEHGLATNRPFMLMNLAVSCLMTGDLVQAETLYSAALTQARSAHVRQIEIGALQGIGRTAVRRGDLAAAVEPLRAGLVLAQSAGLRFVLAEAVCFVAEWLAARGERARAGVLLAVLFRLDLGRFDAMTLQSTLCLSNDEATANDVTAAKLDLDGVAALALELLSATGPPAFTASTAPRAR